MLWRGLAQAMREKRKLGVKRVRRGVVMACKKGRGKGRGKGR